MGSSVADVEGGGPHWAQEVWPGRPPGEGVSLKHLCLSRSPGNKPTAQHASRSQTQQALLSNTADPETKGLGKPAHLCVCARVVLCMRVVRGLPFNMTRMHYVSGKDEQGRVFAFNLMGEPLGPGAQSSLCSSLLQPRGGGWVTDFLNYL